MAIGNRYANTRRIPSDKWSPCSRKDPAQWTCFCYCGEVPRDIYNDLFIEVLQLWKDKLYDLIVYIANTAGFMWDDSVQCVEMMLCELTCLSPSVSGGVQCRIEGEHTNVVVVVRKRLPYFYGLIISLVPANQERSRLYLLPRGLFLFYCWLVRSPHTLFFS